ncbi:MAG: hypothetical protein WKG32_10520 [Gemmatimonadaceae bacterium]
MRDPRLSAELRRVEGDLPLERVDWAAMRRTAAERAALPLARLRRGRAWWEYAAGWARTAVPAAVAAGILLAAVLARGNDSSDSQSVAPSSAVASAPAGASAARDALESAVTRNVAERGFVDAVVGPVDSAWLLEAVAGGER